MEVECRRTGQLMLRVPAEVAPNGFLVETPGGHGPATGQAGEDIDLSVENGTTYIIRSVGP